VSRRRGPSASGPGAESRPAGLLLAATVLGLAAVGGVLVATARGGAGRAVTGPAPGLPAVTVAPVTAAAGSSALGAEGPASAAGAAAGSPAGVSWVLFQGVALPEGSPAGPRVVNGQVRAGYTHDAAGALLAAVQISTRMLLTPGDGWQQVVAEQVLPGPGRELFRAQRAQLSALPDAVPGGFGQFAGYRFATVTPEVAVAQVVNRFGSETGAAPVLQVSTLTVRWAAGPAGPDWRLEMQPDGTPTPTQQRVADLLGFVVWGAP